ncbi:MAG TPA: HAMP domain-containing sensor histidine kinase [Verrucomicrobiae bacterium]|nr:HAMP domain-containing sensor histidine kinase [Verrucomicrobiae bacterium]
MTIRARLTIWYAGILFVSVLLITGLSYHEFLRERSMERVSHGEIDENDTPEDVIQISIFCGIPAAIIALAGGWWLMRKAMTPVAALTEAASRVNESNLNKQLPRTGNGDELDRLTEVFNAMTSRLDTSFNRIREFTLHASHELKTPLTVMHGELETALRDSNLSASSREGLLSQLDEVQRLTKIVDGLSLLTKADAGQIVLKREPVRLDELARDCMDDAQILAGPRQVRVELGRCDEVKLAGDRHRLRQLLLNLTDNAIKYNQPNGTLKLELSRLDKFAELKVSNTGPGIPAEITGRVFERFFRGDASHGNTVDGCGLGLSIAQWIVTAHEGSINITSEPGKWTTVTVRLPLA